MAVRKINDEVFVVSDPIPQIGPADLVLLRRQASTNPRRRARICAHQHNDDVLHEMVIALARGCYIHPHRHVGRSESFNIIEGAVDVVLFSDDGEISDVIEMGDQASRLVFYYRLESNSFHGLVMRSDILIFQEVTNGPFRAGGTQLADFAPPETDAALAAAYARSIQNLTDQYLTERSIGGAR